MRICVGYLNPIKKMGFSVLKYFIKNNNQETQVKLLLSRNRFIFDRGMLEREQALFSSEANHTFPVKASPIKKSLKEKHSKDPFSLEF